MARRRIAEEPASRLAIWARRLAMFSLPVVMLAIIIARAGLLEIQPVLANPAYLGTKAFRLPAIADITTDPIDPPRFETVGRLRSREANPIVYAGLYAAELQKAAYPDVVPLETTTSAQTAYDAARAVITKRRWQVINERPPQPGRRDGYIEAVARTPIMGFRDDVAVRIRAIGQGARVDVRSASRYGRHDFGTNAARVRVLLDDIDDIANVEKPEKAVRPVQKTNQPANKANQPAKR